DLQRILDEVIAQIGLRYDVKHIVDLARYFFPVSLIPRRFRRRALQFGSGLTTQVICSSIIGRAFQNVGFPILPATTPSPTAPPRRRLVDRLLRRTPPPYPAVFRRQLGRQRLQPPELLVHPGAQVLGRRRLLRPRAQRAQREAGPHRPARHPAHILPAAPPGP